MSCDRLDHAERHRVYSASRRHKCHVSVHTTMLTVYGMQK